MTEEEFEPSHFGTIFDPATGLIEGDFEGLSPEEAEQQEAGYGFLFGEILDPDLYVIHDGEAVPRVKNKAEINAEREPLIDQERRRRLLSGFHFLGHVFQFGDDSRQNIQGFASSATAALTIGGADPTDTHWTGEETPARFFDRDNVPVTMDAATAVQFGQAAMAWKSKHIFAARALKDSEQIPENFADDVYWPAA